MNSLDSKVLIPDIGTMDCFNQVETSIAVADSRGFDVAGRQLQMSPPSMTRLVSDLGDWLENV